MMSATFAVVLFTLCLATGLEASTPYKSCGKVADPLDFRMEGCSESPCKFYRGESVKADWDWEVSANTKKLKPRVRVTLLGVTTPYDIGQDNACDTLTNAKCPLEKGEEVTYALTMPVLSSYPKVSMTIEFALTDDSGEAQVCFQVAATVVDR